MVRRLVRRSRGDGCRVKGKEKGLHAGGEGLGLWLCGQILKRDT